MGSVKTPTRDKVRRREYREYFVGLDIGQIRDYTALVIAGRRYVGDHERGWVGIYDIIHLQRFPLGTAYPKVVDDVANFFQDPRLRLNRTYFIMDATGVGLPVKQQFNQRHLRPVAVWITGGFSETASPNGLINVPKVDLVSSLIVVFQGRRIKIAANLRFADVVRDELHSFGYKVNPGTAAVTYEAASEKVHDDLVVAISLITWYGENKIRPSFLGNKAASVPHPATHYDPLHRGDTE